jgi:DNA end-binding protein Ku
VERKDLVKGFEIAKGEYVTVTPEEIESVRLESTKTIDIDQFVPADEIDRLYWDNPYFLAPDGKLAMEPFAVIRSAMARSGKIALGRVVMSQRERILALEPRDKGIIATTLRSHEEVRDPAQAFSDIVDVKPDRDMIAIAERIMAQKEAAFDPADFEDRYEDALRDLIKQKQKGRKIVRPEAPKDTNVIDLMDALKASLRDKGKRPAAKPAAHRRAAAHAGPARKRTKR